ncbi:MAG: fused MFS/spermidine synthase, partial [Planctomycetes bacterium]|nr:fused MFS/spermidine synthase [Planctomycetota bacterium]
VGPLALYLVTFIIAFATTPPWFRVLIGNLAPVMILLLVFLMLSEVKPGTGLELLLYNLTFFAAAMMCHYELARDRPSPQYLTTYFLIMSFGGVLGGIFNSLIAPVVFTQSYEFPLALVVACFMVPKLIPPSEEGGTEKKAAPTAPPTAPPKHVLLWGWVSEDEDYWPVIGGSSALAALGVLATLPAYKWFTSALSIVLVVVVYNVAYKYLWKRLWPLYRSLPKETRGRINLALDVVIPVALGVAFWYKFDLLNNTEWYKDWAAGILNAFPKGIAVSRNTLNIVVLYALPVMLCFFFVDRPLRFGLCVAAILIPTKIREGSGAGVVHTERSFFGILKIEETENRQYLIRGDEYLLNDKGERMLAGKYEYRRLVHGTTLHGTQVSQHDRHILDDFQLLTAMNPWDNLAVLGAIQRFDMRQEPLTYYHRTGPVGAMFGELTRRGKDKEHVAMVGLGTGSVSCYAQKGQKLTFYEIDPAVKKLVADTDQYFTYVSDARKRGAELDFRMGDARLKLKEDTDRKYALLLVDAFSSDSIPVHLLTNEAVALYMERLQEDGILALHISNKFVRLEPVVAAIAEHHGLVARVWNDDAEKQHGKTASSWVALARKPEHLGERLCSPVSDLMVKYYHGLQLLDVIQREYPDLRGALERSTGKQRETVLNFLDKRIGDPQALRFATWIRKYGSEYETLMDILKKETGYGFRPVDTLPGVDAWTDDYADVMRVMMIPELQAVRKFFGLPTPVER